MSAIERKSTTPAEAGLSLIVCSGPRGTVRDNWPCIEYTLQLQDPRRRPIWTGEYRLGVGHVKWPKEEVLDRSFRPFAGRMSSDEENVCRIHARGQSVKKTPQGMATKATP